MSTLAFLLTAKGMHVLATLVCHVLGPTSARRLERLSPWRVWQILVLLGVFAYLGGRVHFLLNNSQIYENRVWAGLTWSGGGLHAGGAVLALALGMWPLARLYRIPIGKLADALAPTLGLGMAVARLGCWIHGCCYGAVGYWPWCLTYPPESSVYQFQVYHHLIAEGAAASLPAHPLQLYFVALGLFVAATSLWLHRHKRFDGEVGLAAACAFSIGSAVLELFRADWTDRVYWGPLPQLLWTALILSVLTVVLLTVAESRHRWSGGRAAAGAAVS